jgi:hypothetical protein
VNPVISDIGGHRGEGVMFFKGIFPITHEYGFGLWDIYEVSKNPKNRRTDLAKLLYKKI